MTLALHRVRHVWGSECQIDIEWSKGRGGTSKAPDDDTRVAYVEEELEPDAFAVRGIPAICLRSDSPVLFERFQLRENTEYFIDVTLPLSKAEAELLARDRPAWPFPDRLVTVFRPDPPRRWRENDVGSVIVSGVLRLKSHAGVLDLSTDYGASLMVEVVCRKIDYLADFQTLLDEVAAELAELLLQFDSPVSMQFDTSDLGAQSDAGLLFQLRNMMRGPNLPAAIEEVLGAFHTRLVQRTEVENISALVAPEIDDLIDNLDFSAFDRAGPLGRLFRGHSPQQLAMTEYSESADTPENRYVKAFLEQCAGAIDHLKSRLAHRRKPAALREAEGWSEKIEEMLSARRWAEVGPLQHFPSNSQVLQKRRGYRDVLKFDLAFRLGMQLSWPAGDTLSDGFSGDVRPVNEIYEYWCFFVLRRVLRELCEKEVAGSHDLISVASDGLLVRLEKGTRSRLRFHYRSAGARRLDVSLFYNRRFRRPNRSMGGWDGSYSASFDPDYSIQLTVTEGGKKRRHWLHFDAKYRMETADAQALFAPADSLVLDGSDDENGTEYDQEIARLHKRDDLFKMHTYRDGILSSRGAYVLFPGNGDGLRYTGRDQNMFVRHPTAFSGGAAFQFPSVGAFDLCPGRDDLQVNTVRTFLADVFDTVLAAGDYQEEAGLFDPI